jgi:L-lysine exporter family protein LysE/ArgO
MHLVIGFLIGFVAAIPMGPVTVFILSQVFKRDFRHGFMGGITAALLDGIYCFVALVGISQITFGLNKYLPFIKVLATILLIVLGIRTWKMSRQYKVPQAGEESEAMIRFSPRPILGVILLYVSNPGLYFFWLAVASAATSHFWVSEIGMTHLLFSVSCGLGALIWYFIATRYVAKYHHQFEPKTFHRIFFVLALMLFAFSAYTIASIFIKIKLL